MPTEQPPSNTLLEQLGQQASRFTNTSLNLPQHLEVALTRLEQGDLKMRVNSVEANRALRRLNTLIRALISSIVFSTFTLTTTQLFLGDCPRLAIASGVLSLISALLLGKQLLSKDSPTL